MLKSFLIFYVFVFLLSLKGFLSITYKNESKNIKSSILSNEYLLGNGLFSKKKLKTNITKQKHIFKKEKVVFENEVIKEKGNFKRTSKRKRYKSVSDISKHEIVKFFDKKKIKCYSFIKFFKRKSKERKSQMNSYQMCYETNLFDRKMTKYHFFSILKIRKNGKLKNGISTHNINTCYKSIKKENCLKNRCYFFLNNHNTINYKKQKKKTQKCYLRKFEELYKKYIIKQDENEEKDEDAIDEDRLDWKNVSNTIIDEWCLTDHPDKYNLTLFYNYLANAHNLEFKSVKHVNNFIKNNEVIEKEKYEKLNKPYLTYTYKFPYINPNEENRNDKTGKDKTDIKTYYTYNFYIPKLINYDEDISTESRYVPSNFKKIQPFRYSPVNYLTISGFSGRNIDTFGSERNKIYSFNTPTDIKRNIFFNDLMLISCSYNQHFFSNLSFLLNLHTLQILVRDKTAIETEFYTDKFNQLQETLKKRNRKGKNDENVKDENESIRREIEKKNELEKQKKKELEDIEKKEIDGTKEKEVDEEKTRIEKQIDEEIGKYISQRKFKFDEEMENFPKKFEGDILKEKEFIDLWKYDNKGEIVEELNTIPLPQIYLHIDDPKYYSWKILQNSGKTAFKEIPTPNRKLEAWRQQINLKQFYKLNFDASISVRRIEKEELSKFKMRYKVKMTRKENKKEINEITNKRNEFRNALYTLVVRDGIIDEYLSDDVSILKKLNKEMFEKDKISNTIEKNATDELDETSEVAEDPDVAKKKSKIFVGSFFKIKDAEIYYLINKELYFIPEYTNWHKKNTQPFIRGQIAKQSRKFDNDYPIYDYRKSDFGMAKFSALNLASIKDCAVIFLDKNVDLSDFYIHVIFLSTSKSEDENIDLKNDQNSYEVISSDINKKESDANDEIVKDKVTHRPVTNPRLVVYAKENSKVNIYESHISLNNKNSGLVNAFSRVVLEEKAKVKHILSQELAEDIWYFHNVSVKNGFKGNYKFVDILLGSLSTRVNLQIEGEKESSQESYALGVLHGKQNVSQYEMFHHEHPQMSTNQLCKFVVSDKAHSVWRSRGRIERNAIKTKLNTLCRNVLFNLGASAVAIPTLEIIPSDIEYANHGATISDLDKEPIFVLMSRGIHKDDARHMVLKSYVNEIMEHIADDNLKWRVLKKLTDIVLRHRESD